MVPAVPGHVTVEGPYCSPQLSSAPMNAESPTPHSVMMNTTVSTPEFAQALAVNVPSCVGVKRR